MRKTVITILLLCAAALAYAQPLPDAGLSRAFAGVSTGNGFHLSWRTLPSDKAGASYEIWRETDGAKAVKVSSRPVKNTSDFFDTGADLSKDNRWILKSSGKELASYSLKGGEGRPYIAIPVQNPGRRNLFRVTQRSFGTSDSYNPGDEGDAYSFTAGDCSVGDLDGDGELEIILKWDPSNIRTPEQTGVSGNTLLDAYKMDGTLLWRIDLGHNVRSTYASVPFVVYDLDGDGKAELVCKTADATVDGQGGIVGNRRADWRSMDEASETFGRTVVGPEYLTVFDGATGKACDTQKFIPIRFPLDSWGGLGGNDNLGIRSEMYTAGVAYLDGVHPSVFFVRGADARTVVAAWDFEGGKLSHRWTFDSSDKRWRGFSGNGNPNVSVADFDGDGADEICVGAMIVDNDGTGLVTTRLRGGIGLHAGDLIPSREGIEVFGTHDTSGVLGAFLDNPAIAVYDGATGEVIWSAGKGETVGRGVAADIDPRYPGAEVWVGPVDQARAGGAPRGRMMMPMRPATPPAYEGPLKGVFNGATGELISENMPSSCNFTIYWDADAQAELLDGCTVSKWDWENGATKALFTAEGVKAIGGTRATPCFSGDILGDWREEVIWVSTDENELRIYMTDVPAADRRTTLLADRQYRLSLVWQNVGHNQPPHTSYDIFNHNK